MGGRKWTQEEDEMLDIMYGKKDIKYIMAKLKSINKDGRSKRAIEKRVQLLGLCNAKDSFTCADLAYMFGVSKAQISQSWGKKYGLKIKKINACLGEKGFTTSIEYNDLMKWLKNNTDKYNTNNLEYLALGKEPEWLKEKRRHDLENRNFMKKIKWTKLDEERVMKYYRDGLKHKEIAEKMNRSEGSVYARIHKILDEK